MINPHVKWQELKDPSFRQQLLTVQHVSLSNSMMLSQVSVNLLVVPTQSYMDALVKYKAHFCFFCSDPCDHPAICVLCGALICIATNIGGAGCIGAETFRGDPSKFECPVCVGTKASSSSLIPYYVAGSGLRRIPKIAWPLLLFTITLKNLDSLVLKLVTMTMMSNYTLDKEYVSVP